MQNSFSLLDKRIQSVLSELKFEATPIQEKSIPHILTGKNVLLIAPTGIGKTEASLLPVFHKFLENPTPGIGILYVTPLRALNRNMLDRVTFWGEKLGFTFAVRHGDTTQNERTKQLKNPPQMMVTTPETINLMLAAPKMSKNLVNVKYVIIDEVHELVESKRGSQLALALERLQAKAGNFQRIGLSATVGDPIVVADFFRLENVIQAGLDRKIELSVEMPKFKKEDVELSNRLHVNSDVVARLRRLKTLIDEYGSVLTFVNTRSTAEVLSSRFEAWEGANKIGVHHSSLSKDVRIITENKFKEGEMKGLIATSSLELGIDIGHIDLVVQYSSPRQVNRLIQRVGRSGHNISKFPRGVVLANDVEDAIESAVIVRNALDRKLEEPNIIEKPLDVLAHQISGLAMENGSMPILNAFKIVKNAYPYRNLDLEEFQSVLDQMVDERIIWTENGNFGKKQKTRLYYYLGVSMIADEAKFFVKDISTNRNIGVFDESFVINNLQVGGLVISHGKPWNIVDIGEREVLVEPAYDISGAIPAWEGEQIPVPFNVAQEVGRFKKLIATGKVNYGDYFVDSNTIDALDKYMSKQKEFFVPDDKTVVMETFGNFLFMYAHFGSKTNETIGKLLSILLSSYLGETVGMKSDPYRIIFEFVDTPRVDLVKKFINDTDLDQVKDILVRSMMRTHLFRYKFLHVAKRFGLMERERDYQRVSVTRLIEAVFDSPVYKETLNEIFTEKLDIEQAKVVLSWLKDGKVKLTEYKGSVSPFTEYAVSRVMRLPELILPSRPESEIIDMMMLQTDAKIAKLYCTYCGSIFYEKIGDLPDKINCPTCKSSMVTYVKGKEDVKELYRKSKLSAENKKTKAELERIAALVSSYGKRAVTVMSGKGIGAETAVRVLGKMRKTDKEMFRDMLEAQKNFLKSKRYWN